MKQLYIIVYFGEEKIPTGAYEKQVKFHKDQGKEKKLCQDVA